MKKLLLLISVLFPCLALAQVPATTGFHRVSQLLSRANAGLGADIVPYATVVVTNTTTGLAATIYSDPLLMAPIANSTVSSDANGNYDYYIPLSYCVNENVSSPGQGNFTTVNINCNPGFD